MPYALRHAGTGELLACRQTNSYQLAYYGLLLWDDAPQEEARLNALLLSERYTAAAAEREWGPSRDDRRKDRLEAEWEQVQELANWRPVLLTEHEAKMGNVKLRNDPSLRVCLRDGRIEADAAYRR
ncbi:hypothetical protein [Cohnella zeiphila]|uniref:Uncharacterized protein n=1 Tax=Cohnella zeiphila TaxID=2761120 RepID=A0A7X0SI00_9BACL|nr:hypothetical protein [Cohnella zeiphila]MBB6730307.1 hypothetical protein [Cohnella zeiphila]